MTAPKGSVLFLCTENSCRSQMAEGLLRNRAGERIEVANAGTMPSRVHPEAVRAMEEIGIDISQHCSKSVQEFLGRHIDTVITVCDRARESCPTFHDASALLHWNLDDPAAARGTLEERRAVFRRVRDELAFRIDGFLAECRGIPGHGGS